MAPLNRSTSAPHAGQLQLQHFTHPHPLHKFFIASDFNCDGCNDASSGVRFRCTACDFDLHEQCATAPHHIFTHAHPNHRLNLVNRPGKSHFCDICKDFTNGLGYTCQECGLFDAHPVCAQITPATRVPALTSSSSIPAGRVANNPSTASFGGCHNNPPVVINHHHHHPQYQQNQLEPKKSKKYSKAGRFAAALLVTSLTGIPTDFSSQG